MVDPMPNSQSPGESYCSPPAKATLPGSAPSAALDSSPKQSLGDEPGSDAKPDMMEVDTVNEREPGNCEHLLAFLRHGASDSAIGAPGLTALERAAEFVILTGENPPDGQDANSKPALRPSCFSVGCTSKYHGDLHLCLSCIYVSCRSEKHLAEHVTNSRHVLWFSFRHEAIFCASCDDYVFSCQAEQAISRVRLRTTGSSENSMNFRSRDAKSPMNERQQQSQRPGPSHSELAKLHSEVAHWSTTDSLPGLYNLGNMCYMNSILQVLLHTPSLRNYFLGDMHRPFCAQASKRKKESSAGSTADSPPECLACAVDDLTCSVFAATSPSQFLIPQTVMDIIWKQADALATYAQHDAHEFLITALNMIHTRCQQDIESDRPRKHVEANATDRSVARDDNQTTSQETKNPGSIIRSTFEGKVRSDVICGTCNNSSPTFESFFDISLDLDAVSTTKAQPGTPNNDASSPPTPLQSTGSGPRDKTDRWESESNVSISDFERASQNETANSLAECLSRFTRLESLGPGNRMFCSRCQEKRDSQKQISLSCLPRVLCFHFKRFEHSRARGHSQKLDCAMGYPVNGLDLRQFTTNSVLRQRQESTPRSTPVEGEKKSMDQKDASLVEERNQGGLPCYDLYAVVNHTGKIDRGHYTTQVRWQNRWFRCDDEKLTEDTSMGENVVSREAYLLFYVARCPV